MEADSTIAETKKPNALNSFNGSSDSSIHSLRRVFSCRPGRSYRLAAARRHLIEHEAGLRRKAAVLGYGMELVHRRVVVLVCVDTFAHIASKAAHCRG